MEEKIIDGKITIEFIKGGLVPEISIAGKIDMIHMVALPYNISTAYQQYLDKIGLELKKKVEAKGIEVKEEKQETQASKEQSHDNE